MGLADGALGPVGTPVSSVSKSEREATILRPAQDYLAQLVEASPKHRRNVHVRRLVGPPLKGHKRAAARLVRLRKGAVTLPVLAFLGAQA